jgi:enolase
MKIKKILPVSILNSQGEKAVQVTLETDQGTFTASAPRGISFGQKEAKHVHPYTAIKQIKQLGKTLLKQSPKTQKEMDAYLVYSKAAANATLPLSIAFAKANRSFPVPQKPRWPKLMMLIFEGGKHGNPKIRIQEFMYIVNCFETGKELFDQVKKHLLKNKYSVGIGSEGGFSPPNLTDKKILTIMTRFAQQKFKIALDVANNHASFPTRQISQYLTQFPQIQSIEDPVKEQNLKAWTSFFKYWGSTKQIVADDLTVTNSQIIEEGANKRFNAVIIKPNQQGTLTQAQKAVETARRENLKIVVSHRGTETNEDYLADFALAMKADFVKFGGPNRGERIAKYNRLLKLLKKH